MILSTAAFVVEWIAGMVVAPRAVPARRRPPVQLELPPDATQSRPSPGSRAPRRWSSWPSTSGVLVPPIEAAEALAVACHGTRHADSEFTEIATLRGDHLRLTVTPALNGTRRRRLFGCLQDATLDLVQAHVVSWTTTPAATAVSDAPAGDAS